MERDPRGASAGYEEEEGHSWLARKIVMYQQDEMQRLRLGRCKQKGALRCVRSSSTDI